MRARFLLAATICCLALGMGAGIFAPRVQAIGPIAIDCDRACLEDLATQYLNALVAHDPSAPASRQRRQVHRERSSPRHRRRLLGHRHAGRRLQASASPIPIAEQIGCMVTMHEGDHLVIMGMRLRVQLGRITEIETTYYRQGGGGPSNFEGYDKFTPEPIWFDNDSRGQACFPRPAHQHRQHVFRRPRK